MNGQKVTVTGVFASVSKSWQTFPKRHLAKFVLSYCLFPCVSLLEARDRSITGKLSISSSVILLPLISEHNRSPAHSGPADWALHTASSQWDLDEASLNCEGPSSQSLCWTDIRARLPPASIWQHLLPCLPGTSFREDEVAQLTTNMCHHAAEEPPLSLYPSDMNTGTEPRNTSEITENFSH